MRAWLERKKLGPEAIDHAIEELSAAGFLDDARFTEQFAEDKRGIEQWGTERIQRDLLRRGVSPRLVDEVVFARDREGELEAAVRILSERMAPPSDDRERDKAWRLLIRKGYEPELAYEAVRTHGATRAV